MKNTNREVIIAIVVALIMILVCVLTFVISKSSTKQASEIKVYKLYEREDNSSDHYYKECSIDTENKILVQDVYKKVKKLNDASSVTGVGITGNYKIVIDDDFIAFDNNEDNLIYNGNKNKLYNFNTTLYEEVINWCN